MMRRNQRAASILLAGAKRGIPRCRHDRDTRQNVVIALIRDFQIIIFAFLCFLPWSATAAPIASRYTEPYPIDASKKGLQVEIVEDALALGVKHAALNFNLSQL